MSKTITITLTLILAAFPLLILQSTALAVSVPQPSVPSFTVTYVDRSYDVPIQYHTSTDAFTGQPVTTSTGGNHVTNKTIDISIRNQPFTTVNSDDGKTINLYYTVCAKGHYASWDEPSADNGYYIKQVPASSSGNTVLTLVIGSTNDLLMGYANVYIPEGGTEDFRVKAQAGYLTPDYGGHILPMPLGYDFTSFGESAWSSTQTITLSGNTVTTTPMPLPIQPTTNPTQSPPTMSSPTNNPSATPIQPNTQADAFLEIDWWQFVAICLAVALVLLVAALVLQRRKYLEREKRYA